ncbi:MAG: hypothetical protein WBZ37_11660 [Mycobacterium sp.]
MTTTQSAPNAAPENISQAGTPNQYHLHGHGIQVSYYPDGAGPLTVDGPIVLAYQDANHTATFRRSQVQVVAVEGLGTCVTVTLQILVDFGTRTATLLVPSVVLGTQTSAPVHTELIRTSHTSTLTGIGHPQRDSYTVTSLTGQASLGILPL